MDLKDLQSKVAKLYQQVEQLKLAPVDLLLVITERQGELIHHFCKMKHVNAANSSFESHRASLKVVTVDMIMLLICLLDSYNIDLEFVMDYELRELQRRVDLMQLRKVQVQ